MSVRRNKYSYLFVVQGHYRGYGYEDLCQSENKKEAYSDLKAYRDNEVGTFRIIKRRELKEVF